MKKEATCSIKTSIGGQALMEGIMMRGPKRSAMAVRNPQGEMVVEEWDTKGSERGKFFKLPIIRGVFNFADSMISGYKCMMRSAEISGLEEIEEEERRIKEAKKAEKAAKKAEKTAKKAAKKGIVPEEKEEDGLIVAEDENKDENKDEKKTSTLTDVVMVASVILAVVIFVGLFMWLPSFLYSQLGKLVPSISENRFLKSLFEGVMRVGLLIAYMALISLMKDIRRTFMYHGAEHKTIFCYEQGLELTVENVRKQKRFHPRCGTSFLVIMVLVGIFIGFFIPAGIPNLARVGIKILLVPVIMGIGYELIKLAGKHDNFLVKIISAPGMWMQRITTVEPDDDMIECAIVAIKKVIPDDGSDLIK